MVEPNHHELLAQVASLYYEQEKTQNEIADLLGLSRVKIYRLLKEARQEQVVQIVIHWPIERDCPLESTLAQAYGLKEALVLKSNLQDGGPSLHKLGQLGARFLEGILQDGMTLTVCLGRSTYEVVNAIHPNFRAHVNVAQAIGSMPFATQELDSAALARILAQKLGGSVLYMSSPLMADTPEAAQVVRSQNSIQHTLSTARSADIALMGIGNLNPAASGYVRAGVITAGELSALANQGAVGDIGGQFFTASGDIHACTYNQRVIGLTLEEMRRIPKLIAIAKGLDKSRAILGALRTGVVDVLCTDDETARAILALDDSRAAEHR
jgi:DNA-binding transcriptional regulator LsrR (DeoR family)